MIPQDRHATCLNEELPPYSKPPLALTPHPPPPTSGPAKERDRGTSIDQPASPKDWTVFLPINIISHAPRADPGDPISSCIRTFYLPPPPPPLP